MRYYVLLSLVTAAMFTMANAVMAVAVSVAWPRCRRAVERMRANNRAQVIAALRLSPFAVAMACAIIVASVFIRFEPRDTSETPGIVLGLACALGAGLLTSALFQGAVTLRGSLACGRLIRECGREWKRAGQRPVWIVDTTYPVAAIAGIFRARVLISSRIVGECPKAEMDAIIRHETAHLRRRDNLVRAAMRCLPDVLSFTGTGVAMHDAWSAAVEQAADDDAAGTDAQARTDLAAALVRVAGMADGLPPAWMPGMVAFYEGTNLEDRVRRLLSPGATRRRVPLALAAVAMLSSAAAAVIVSEGPASNLHTVVELAVRLLP